MANSDALSIGLVFFLQSATFATWLVHIPELKARLGLSEGELGGILFGLPFGLLFMNPFTGWITARFGALPTTIVALTGMSLSIWIPILASTPSQVFWGLSLLGLAASLTNVAMNTTATHIEQKHDIRILSTCHGFWSLGNLVCSSLLALAISQGVPTAYRLAALALITGVALYWLYNRLKGRIVEPKTETNAKTKGFALPNMQLLVLIFIGVSVTMGEGLAFDWSGVYLREVAGSTEALAAFGLSAFAALMALMRLLGDWLKETYSDRFLLTAGGLMAAFGIGLCVFFPVAWVCFLGLMLLGGGVALGSPLLYSASMRIPGVPPSAGLATFASLSFFGFMSAPPLIGYLGEHFGLRTAFATIAVVLLLGAFLAHKSVGND